MPLASGTRLGPYEVVCALGAGGMGEVYRARDTKLNRDVAIKVLPDLFAADPERLARFEREAQVLASLNHSGIAHVYGVEDLPPKGGSHATVGLVMELVEGEDLAQRLARGAIPIDEALAIARQIAAALEAAHEQGIVHRDLKPANIKVRADGTVKVLDFGLAKAMAPEGAIASADAANSPTLTARATQMGMIIGTAAYMSPEQARGKAVDKRADIWAFGVVLFEMLTGRQTFSGDTMSEVLASVMKDDPDWARLPATLPVPVTGVLRRCLVKDPKHRLRDIGDVWLLLDSDGDSTSGATPARSRRVWAWAVAAGIAGAAATWIAIAASRPAATTVPVAFVEPPPAGTRFVGAPMLSPDSRRLAWIAVDAAGKARVWTREIGDAAAHVVDGTDGVTMAFWSPDSRQLAFAAHGKVLRIAAGGGAVSLIVVANPRSGVWLSDNDLLLAVTGEGLMRVPAIGGALRPARGFTSEAFRNLQVDGLALSPDGQCVLFSQFGGETGVYAARLDGTARRLLYPGEQSSAVFVGADVIVREDKNVLMAQRFNGADMSLVGEAFPVAQNVGADAFSGGAGGVLSFVAGATGTSRLIWFTRDGKEAGMAGPEGEYTEVAISRGGRWLGFSRRDRADGNVDVWLQALPGGAPSRVTSDPDIDHLFTISHDERDLTWEAHAKGTLNLMRRPVDGSTAPQLVRVWGRAGGPADWSPDGRFVLYHSDDGTSGSNLWAVPMGGSGDPVRMTPPGFGSHEGQFSPDGRWLAFIGNATGGDEVYVQRVEGMKLAGGPVRVSESGGERPLWRHDGAELFFMNRGTVMAAEFHGQGDRPAAVPRTLFTIVRSRNGSSGFGRSYAAMPDGQRFVAIVSTAEQTPQPATVILNWRASLNGK